MKKVPGTFLLALSAAVFGVLAYPPFNIALFAWAAFVPFLALVRRCGRWPAAFGWGYLSGWLFWLGTMWWVGHVTVVGMLALVSYLALYWAVFGVTVWLYGCYFEQNPLVMWLGIPTDWVILEWIRSWLMSGFGWNLLGYSQWQVLPVIQIADLVGVWGVSWLVMWANVTLYGLWRKWLPKECVAGAIVGIGLILGYGLVRLSASPGGEPVTVAVVQGNIPQTQKWDEAYRDMIMDRYAMLTRQAAEGRPDLIIWPETSLPDYLDEPAMEEWLAQLAREVGTRLLVGAARQAGGRDYNSASLWGPDGKLIKVHDKLHLVPFGEFIPFEQQFPWLRDLVPMSGDFSPGERYTLLPLNPHLALDQETVSLAIEKRSEFGVLICFEDVFPGLVRRFVRQGADFLVVITNDAWFGPSGAADQHAAASVFRAIEHRVPVVRVANTGYSCVIDPYGRIVAEVRQDGQHLFVAGVATHAIPLDIGRHDR